VTLSRALPDRVSPPEATVSASSGQLASGGVPETDVAQSAWEADYEAAARVVAAVEWETVLPRRASGWRWRAGQAVKRAMDLVLASFALLVLSPVLVVIAVVVVLDTGRPVFYPWRVLGYRGRRFTGYKFRTMVRDADELKSDLLHLNEMTGPVFKMRNDPRVTRAGRFLRRFSLDELPQLWSVVRGDMSLVGPRPPSPAEFVRFEPRQRMKLAVRPGITCLWQVSGRSEITDWARWAALDLEYIERWSLWLDVRTLFRTVPVVLSGHGAY
jgi:lipopolysaccharide/colanic/teichoic acid biosynthesis glycosyltransferase